MSLRTNFRAASLVDDDLDGLADCDEGDRCLSAICAPDRRCATTGIPPPGNAYACLPYELCSDGIDDDSDGQSDGGDDDCLGRSCANDAGTCVAIGTWG